MFHSTRLEQYTNIFHLKKYLYQYTYKQSLFVYCLTEVCVCFFICMFPCLFNLDFYYFYIAEGDGSRGFGWGQPPPETNIKSIFRISRKGEEDRLAACNLDNHTLLWHGSSPTNLISILKRGLLVTPPEAPITGFRFGRVSLTVLFVSEGQTRPDLPQFLSDTKKELATSSQN